MNWAGSQLAVALAVAGCTGSSDDVGVQGPSGDVECPEQTIVFLNRNGGSFENGFPDSVDNRAILPMGQSALVPPFDGTEQDWQATLECFRDLVSPYHIAVTEDDPGEVDHLEIVTSGDERGTSIGTNTPVHVAFGCPVNPREVAFTFDDPDNNVCSIDGVVTVQHCYEAAFALGVMIGLHQAPSHSGEVMSFGCFGRYTDQEFTCGLGGDIPFDCGACGDQPIQNSHDALIAAFGPACGS